MVVGRLIAGAAAVAAAYAIGPLAAHGRQTGDVIAIRDVTVIPMTGTPPIERATVIVRADRIAAVGPAGSTAIPPGARVVEGAGKYLMPGLIEMHAHLSKARGSSLGLFVANGITTLRDMGGDHEELLRWRREIVSGARVGPRVLIAGPYLESASNIARMRKDPPDARVEPFERIRIAVGSPEDARRIVAELSARELDFLKIRTTQNVETYRAINEAAAAHGLTVVGHVAYDPQTVLEAGQDGIEHSFLPPTSDAEREARKAIWKQFAARGVPIVPTLVAFTEGTFPPIDHLRAMVADDGERADPRRRYVSRFMLLDWREQFLETSAERQQALKKIWEPIVGALRDMHAAGMDLLVGSDVAVLNVFPGFTLHDELERFVATLGLTPAETLDRATRRSATFLGIDRETGTIEPGKVADLVLLEANPLDDIRHTRRIAGVVLRGTFYDRAGLERVLAAVASAPDIRQDDWGRTRVR